MATTFAVRPEMLLDARRALLREVQALTGVWLDPPATDATTALTRAVFEGVTEDVEAVANDLRGPADGLACLLGRELESAAELRTMADRLPPVDAAETRGRADERERQAQADWRTAAAGYQQRRRPSDVPGQPAPAGMTPSAPERRPLSAELVDPPLRSAFLESELVDREPE